MPKMSKEEHHSGKNAETKGVGNLKGKAVTKKKPGAKRNVAPGKKSIKNA